MLRGSYKRNEYRKVILPLTVLRRFDCLLAPTKEQVLAEFKAIKTKPETVQRRLLSCITGRPFYNLSKMQERDTLGYEGRFWAGLPRINDGGSLFLQHMLDTLTFTIGGQAKTLVVSKLFDNEDFGFNKITVERSLRLNFQATEERIERLDEASGFKNLAASNKKNEEVRQKEIEAGQKRYKDRKAFLADLKVVDRELGAHLNVLELKAVLNALGERGETAEICRDRSGNPEPDTELRDTENVPLKESIDAYFKREVLPHVPDAWIDEKKTKVGYEIPLNRHFYRYEPLRPLEDIQADIRKLEDEIMEMLAEVAR